MARRPVNGACPTLLGLRLHEDRPKHAVGGFYPKADHLRNRRVFCRLPLASGAHGVCARANVLQDRQRVESTAQARLVAATDVEHKQVQDGVTFRRHPFPLHSLLVFLVRGWNVQSLGKEEISTPVVGRGFFDHPQIFHFVHQSLALHFLQTRCLPSVKVVLQVIEVGAKAISHFE